ncbi:TonB-dependent receptor [uncultured Bradyrhizobium sp.]|uniref:TonB-dependent receptor n=1 Tax=uncultured Bradyrhizobium sp. TaxID=199684 RepID=UPI0035C9FF66
MGQAKLPRSLRSIAAAGQVQEHSESYSGKRVSAVAGLIAVASFSGAEAQQSNLPPVMVDAPVARPRPAATRPSADQVRARSALRRAARRAQPAQVAAVPFPNAAGLRADRDPYANPSAPYLATGVQASSKFPQPIANTPKSITVLTKDVLEDKNATTLKQALLSTAGVTLGTGEGGNAFGDRFFIRGFDARNDVFIDGVRDPGVSVRENFFTEQVEILRGPGSSFAGRGTTGGAINIVTKQATTAGNFYNMDTTFGTDMTKRIVLDANQVISPTLAVRAGGLFQEANIAGRDRVRDDRNGGFGAVAWTPFDAVKVTANYIHTNLHGLPDFGVPYYRPSTATTAGGPFPDFGVNRANFYGFPNRDYSNITQDIGTVNAEVVISPELTVSNKTRVQRSVLDYVGTLPEAPVITNPNPLLWTLSANPQSRYQTTEVVANQTEAAYKFDTGPFRHNAVSGLEISREHVSIDRYAGLSSEALPGGFSGSGSLTGVNIFNPQFTDLPFGTNPQLTGLPTTVSVGTQSFYVLDTANYNDVLFLNGGVRFDNYGINTTGYATVNAKPNTFGSQAAEFRMINYNGGVVYKPLPWASVYAAYATSSNPVGAEFDGTAAQYGGLAPVLNGNLTQIFGPEQNQAAEVGTKFELFDKRLLVTAALFQTEKENARESRNVTAATATAACPFPAPAPVGNISCITAGAAYRIQGIDLGVAGKITDKWSLFGGLVLMDTKVTKSLIPPANTALYSTNVGLPLSNVAHQSFSLLTKYQVTDIWEVGGQAVYRSKIYGGTFLAANQGTQLPGYWRFDAFAEAQIDKHWKVKLFVNNVFNKLYYDALYQSAAPFVLEAPGRAAYIVLSARY